MRLFIRRNFAYKEILLDQAAGDAVVFSEEHPNEGHGLEIKPHHALAGVRILSRSERLVIAPESSNVAVVIAQELALQAVIETENSGAYVRASFQNEPAQMYLRDMPMRDDEPDHRLAAEAYASEIGYSDDQIETMESWRDRNGAWRHRVRNPTQRSKK